MKTKQTKFNLIDETTVLTKGLDDDDALYIKGIANSGLEDRAGDIVTSKALESICEQASSCNLHLEHARGVEDVIGTITEAKIVELGVEITARIRNKFKSFIQELFDDGVKLGLSIAGLVEYEENNFKNIISWDLTEISLVAIPCDKNTMGTVVSKSFNEFIIRNMEGKTMTDGVTIEDVTNLINEAINEIKEGYDEKFDEIEARFTELETIINELKDGDNGGSDGGDDEGGKGIGDGDDDGNTGGNGGEDGGADGKAIQDMMQKMMQEMQNNLQESINKGIEDNMLEFFSKAFNSQNNTNPSFRFHEKNTTQEEDNKILTSREISEKIIQGEL